jgi:hypothetical protein
VSVFNTDPTSERERVPVTSQKDRERTRERESKRPGRHRERGRGQRECKGAPFGAGAGPVALWLLWSAAASRGRCWERCLVEGGRESERESKRRVVGVAQ